MILQQAGSTRSLQPGSPSWGARHRRALFANKPSCCQRPAGPAPQAAAAGRASPWTRQADWRRLQNPAKIGAKGSHTTTVQDYGDPLSLDAYMRLPVQAYAQLEPSMIFPMGGSTFLLKLSRVEILGVWVAPEVEVDVTMQESPPRVVLESRSCRLPGSPFFASLEGRFALRFRTELTWQPSGGSQGLGQPTSGGNGANGALQSQRPATPSQQGLTQQGQQGQQQQAQAVDPAWSASWLPRWPDVADNNAAGRQPGTAPAASGQQQWQPLPAQQRPGRGQIDGDLTVEVWSEVVAPFDLLPRPFLEASCNAVVGGLVGALLPLFMRRLGEDYEKWATDAAYRETRSKAVQAQSEGQPLVEQLNTASTFQG